LSARERPRRGESAEGFVLVGVVMMVIALTIIGLSLISLSGYETQFYGRSVLDRQALYSASGGVELVKQLVLSNQGSPAVPRLSSAGLAVGREGIVSALAWQDNPPDTSGQVDWTQDVHIRVGVNVNGAVRTIEGTFTATNPESPYHYLMTVPGQVIAIALADSQECHDPWGSGYGRGTVTLTGNAWQNIPPADSAWKNPECFDLQLGASFMIRPTRAPVPLASQFISDHLGSAVQATMTIGTTGTPPINVINLSGSDSGTFFKSPPSDPTTTDPALLNSYDFVSWNRLRVRVQGTAIWLVPAGLHVQRELLIERMGEGPANLIIVAGPNGRDPSGPDVGLHLLNGISISPLNPVNLFLVTDGTLVDSDEDNEPATNDIANRLCIFAQNYFVLPGGLLNGTMRYKVRSYGGPSMQNVSDALLRRGLLPRPSDGATTGLTLVSGSWTTSPGLQ